ncbi:MAG: DUF1858 domain-containing protein [Thermodesulfobacteriota bacterium]
MIGEGKKKKAGEKLQFDENMNIGEVIDKYPKARKIFQKHFGKQCFNCPGSRKETIYFGALMHNKDVEEIIKDLNAQIKI